MPLVSSSEDGEIVARIIRGSSSHSVVAAWKEMVRELRQGGQVIIIPDGPRGPNRVFKPGALRLAQETGAWLVPFSFSSSRRRWLRSWDNFLLALPFALVVAQASSSRAFGRGVGRLSAKHGSCAQRAGCRSRPSGSSKTPMLAEGG